jgi:hypothetical protein
MRAVLAEQSSFPGNVPAAFDFGGGPDETSSSQREDSPFALAV